MRTFKSVCVFCGSSRGASPEHAHAAAQLGTALAQRNITLVYGGGHVGLMGVIADAVLAAGGKAIGVMPEQLVAREIAHTGLTELRVVHSMHERKQLMCDLSDAFIMLSGGFGSWDEFFEALTWSQLGIHSSPCGILNVAGYYDPMLVMMDRAVNDGFVRASQQERITVASDVARLLDGLAATPSPVDVKWTTPVKP